MLATQALAWTKTNKPKLFVDNLGLLSVCMENSTNRDAAELYATSPVMLV